MKRQYFPALDGLRCVAILIVLIAHSRIGLLRVGGVGVDIFFVLSGFLITSILLSEHDRFGSINYRNFYARRFLRLLPCMVLVIAFVAVERRLALGYWPLRDLSLSIGYAMNWARTMEIGNHFPLGHTWSLAIEEQFYLVWPVIVALVCSRTRSPRSRFAVLSSMAIAIMAYRCVMSGILSADRVYYGSDTHCDGLIFGSALAFFVATLPAGLLAANASRWVGWVFSPLAVLTLGVIVFKTLLLKSSMGRAGSVAVTLASVTIVLDIIAGSHCLLESILTQRLPIWIGKISYGLYLWHLPIYYVLADFHLGWIAKLTIGIPLSIAVSALSFYTVEKRIMSYKVKFTRENSDAIPQSAFASESLPLTVPQLARLAA